MKIRLGNKFKFFDSLIFFFLNWNLKEFLIKNKNFGFEGP